jgi:hypothetical protein
LVFKLLKGSLCLQGSVMTYDMADIGHRIPLVRLSVLPMYFWR